jgi:hypothetical protein
MSDELSEDNAASIYNFYESCGRNLERTISFMLSVRDDTDDPEEIVRCCKLFFANAEYHIPRAIVGQAKKDVARREAAELKRKKEAEEDEEFVRRNMPSGEQAAKLASQIPLTLEEIKVTTEISSRINRFKDHFHRFTKSAQLHLLMSDYNWDGGIEVPRLIATSELCDKGTALICAWRTDYVYDTFNGTEEAFGERQLVLDIHERWQRGFYKGNIRFDPRKDDWNNWDWTCGRNAENFPGMDPTFLGPSPGEKYIWKIKGWHPFR